MSDSESNSKSDEDNGLEEWLASNKLSKLLPALNDNDIERLSDFAALETKKEIEDFAGDLQLKVIKRKKFVKAVLKLNAIRINASDISATAILKPKPKPEPETKIEKDSAIECGFSSSDISQVLKQWKLSQYAKAFDDAGFDDVDAWQELTLDELTNVLKMKYAHAKKFIKNRATLVQKQNSTSVDVNDAARFLKEWKLERYIDIFQEEDYGDVNVWQDLTMDELTEVLKMKYAHAKKFIKNRETLVQKSSSDSDENRSKRENKKPYKSRKKRQEHSKKISESESNSSEEEPQHMQSNEKEISGAARFLKQWELEKYIAVFEDEGYENIKEWQNLTMEDLKNDLKMKTGHARIFMRKCSKLVKTSNVLPDKRIDQTPGAFNSCDTKMDYDPGNEGEENKYPECTPPPQQLTIETDDQRSERERRERRAAYINLSGDNNIVPILNYKNVHRPHKTILVIGATGTGKTTLLNSMMNYLYEVEFEDKYRFKLIKEVAKSDGQAMSQTDDVTPYILSPPILDYDLTVVDTPGFGDTRGLDHDKIIIENIRKCFDTIISEIDAICFVIRAPQARLTATQRYIFSQVLGIFGADIKDNIFILLTFADQKKPPAIAALTAGKIPFVKYFKLNNSAFDLPEVEEDDDMDASGNDFAQLFWVMGMTAFKRLFSELNKVQTKSLSMTKQVLKRRKQLETSVEGITPVINEGFDILESMRVQILIIDQNSAVVDANQNFTMQVPMTRRVKDPITGHYTTICDTCQWTCHLHCGIPNNGNKNGCSAMGSGGYCTICPNKCHWSKHTNQPYVWKAEKYYVEKDVKELKDKYFDSKSKMSASDQIIEGMTGDLADTEQKLSFLIDKVRKCLNKLSSIALRPNVMTQEDYIEKLITAEEDTKKVGWQKRIGSLRLMMKNNQMMTNIQDENYDPFANFFDVKEHMMRKRGKKGKVKQKQKNGLFGWW